uniref:Uncharacterized protein n=1 Tax=Arundo donax TaxID=35708 RepID=A0A0A9HHA6_ARUDO
MALLATFAAQVCQDWIRFLYYVAYCSIMHIMF